MSRACLPSLRRKVCRRSSPIFPSLKAAFGHTPSKDSMRYEIVNVNRPLPLSTVAKLCGSSTDTIKELNPALHRGIVPPQGYDVRLPKGSKEAFEVAYANLGTLPSPDHTSVS